MQTLIATPPAYDPTICEETYPVAPILYKGVRFDFGLFAQHVRVDEMRGVVHVLDKEAAAFNIQMELPAEDENYPLYFELTGMRFRYSFSVWSDRIIIAVSCHHHKELSFMFPVTAEELLRALSTIAADLP